MCLIRKIEKKNKYFAMYQNHKSISNIVFLLLNLSTFNMITVKMLTL